MFNSQHRIFFMNYLSDTFITEPTCYMYVIPLFKSEYLNLFYVDMADRCKMLTRLTTVYLVKHLHYFMFPLLVIFCSSHLIFFCTSTIKLLKSHAYCSFTQHEREDNKYNSETFKIYILFKEHNMRCVISNFVVVHSNKDMWSSQL